ncbi:MAG: hypothetical protein P8L90_05740 [Flavobacteriaceae bacterium]|nr:hypothetical protein [Flavobacteriaceae bacterium]
MKKVFCFILLFCFYSVYSQSPEKFTYQSIVRSSNGAILQSADVGIRLSVLKSSSIGNSVYSEEHSAKTNKNGIITLIIGDGTTSDDFSSIDWSTGTYYLKIEVDPLGGNDYLIESTSQLLSVPYALYSGTSGNSINKLKLKGENYLSLSDNELSANKVDLSNNIKGTLSLNSGGTGASDAAGARTALGVDAAGTDNSTAVSLATITDNYLTIDGQEVTAGTVPLTLGGTGASDAAGARTALGVDAAGTDNSTAVSLATVTDNYLTITGQEVTAGNVPLTLGGTGASDASGARTALGVDAAGTDNSTAVSLATITDNYLTITGQEVTAGTVPLTLGGTGASDAAGARTALGVDAAGTDNSTAVSLATITDNYLTITGQEVTAGTVPLTLGGTGASDAAGARTALGVDAAGTDNSTAVSLATITDNYLTIDGQEVTAGTVPLSLGGTGASDAAGARTALGVDAAGTDNSTAVSLATVTDNYLTITGQEVTAGNIPLSLGGTGASDASGARTALGLGTIATQGSDAVNIDGGAIDGTTIGTTTPSLGTFSTVNSGTIQSIGDTDITVKTGNAATGTITITDGANGNINISPNGTGQVVIDDLTFPAADGANGEVLKTDGSGNLSWTSAGGGRESVTMLSNDDVGIDNFVIDENTYPSGQIFSIDPKDDSTNDIEITLPALTIGLKYTFVVNRDAQSNVYLQISSPSSGKLYGVAYCDDSSAGNITEEISGTTFKIANGYADRGTRIEVFSDGELWHIIAYIPEGCDHVSHT